MWMVEGALKAKQPKVKLSSVPPSAVLFQGIDPATVQHGQKNKQTKRLRGTQDGLDAATISLPRDSL